MELAPFTKSVVAKASSGHIPLPFLINNCKELAAKLAAKILYFQKNYLKR
jgi:hypothetical protein